MKKSIVLLLSTIILIACSQSNQEKKLNKKIGVAKFISHSALDMAEKGFLDKMSELSAKMNLDYDLIFDMQNANGDVNVNLEIANKFKYEKVDLIYSISTATTLAMIQQNPSTPIIFSLVTDPVGAGIREKLEPYNTLVNGISDMPPIAEQMELILELMPNIKKLGHIYTPGEQNSVKQMEIISKICKEKNIELLLSPVHNTYEVKQAAIILAPKVDAFYISKDNYTIAAISSVSDTAYKHKIPLFTAEPAVVNSAKVTLAYGLDSYKSGKAAARMALSVLNGTDITKLPVGPVAGTYLYINLDLASEFNLNVPKKMIDTANEVIETKSIGN